MSGDIRGEVTAKTAEGGEYRLRMSLRCIAQLQSEYGQDLAPLMDAKEGELPDFGVMLRIVELGLQRHHPDAGPEVADDLLTENIMLATELMTAAFPQAEKSEAPGKRKAASR